MTSTYSIASPLGKSGETKPAQESAFGKTCVGNPSLGAEERRLKREAELLERDVERLSEKAQGSPHHRKLWQAAQARLTAVRETIKKIRGVPK